MAFFSFSFPLSWYLQRKRGVALNNLGRIEEKTEVAKGPARVRVERTETGRETDQKTKHRFQEGDGERGGSGGRWWRAR